LLTTCCVFIAGISTAVEISHFDAIAAWHSALIYGFKSCWTWSCFVTRLYKMWHFTKGLLYSDGFSGAPKYLLFLNQMSCHTDLSVYCVYVWYFRFKCYSIFYFHFFFFLIAFNFVTTHSIYSIDAAILILSMHPSLPVSKVHNTNRTVQCLVSLWRYIILAVYYSILNKGINITHTVLYNSTTVVSQSVLLLTLSTHIIFS